MADYRTGGEKHDERSAQTGEERGMEMGEIVEEVMVTNKEGNRIKPKRRSRRKVFWGIVLVAGAMAMLLSKLGFFGGVSFGQIAFSLILAGILLNGILGRSFGQILFSLAFLVILNDELLHLEAITPWPVLLAAGVITVGMNLLFPGFHKGSRNKHLSFRVEYPTKRKDRDNREEGAVSYENAFCGTVKYVTGEVSEIYLNNSFGGMEVFFNDAVLKNGSAQVHLSNCFGGVDLYVPADWQVTVNVDTAFGSVEESGRRKDSEGNVLYIDGEVAFGGLEIHYI